MRHELPERIWITAVRCFEAACSCDPPAIVRLFATIARVLKPLR